jgi:fluoride ion exporter CrcB/FEX
MGQLIMRTQLRNCNQLDSTHACTSATNVGGRCGEWRWAACVTSDGVRHGGGAIFLDLPANALGCFLLGILSPSSALTLRGGAAVALLPERHRLQTAVALHTALRTGFLGSLTTFASWYALPALALITTQAAGLSLNQY